MFGHCDPGKDKQVVWYIAGNEGWHVVIPVFRSNVYRMRAGGATFGLMKCVILCYDMT